ncbi:MAG: type I glutamate--ammonia ligase [Candidatus Aenigmarchaeota archaeon]|nr:type I glutamate--ammonia ligase [Candidatus Aenigmarchaeota archaeon]
MVDFAANEKVDHYSLFFPDPFGVPEHMAAYGLTEEDIERGIGYDGSSIRLSQEINESDMLLVPDISTAFVDPFNDKFSQLNIICNSRDPITQGGYSRDPRHIAQKAEGYLKGTGIADTVFIGPEMEFHIFDDIMYLVDPLHSFYQIVSHESPNAAAMRNNSGPRAGFKEGYFPAPPIDTLNDIRCEMASILRKIGIEPEAHHHEVSTSGQNEIDIKYSTLVKSADNVMMLKYVVKNVARRHGKHAIFMPKPIFEDNGSGMHVHSSLWSGGNPLFHKAGNYANLSELGLHYIGGLLQHAPSLLAICAPTTNSYRRLIPGFEAPVNLTYSRRNRSAAIRIPMVREDSPAAKRVEFRPPDPTANPYMAFSAILMAGLDGIENNIDPGEPVDEDIYKLPSDRRKGIPSTPGSLEDALRALEQDHGYLLKGGVFSRDFLLAYIDRKHEKEINPMKAKPHPDEFRLYAPL